MAAVRIVLGSSVRFGSQNRKWPLRRSERGASFRPQVLSRVRALRSDYPGSGSSEGLPNESHPGIMHGGAHALSGGCGACRRFATVGDPESLGFSARRLERITSWFEARTKKGDPSGFVVAIARGGKLAYLQATGFEDHDKKIPMRPDSIFRIGSMSKQITSVATMMLVDEGKLDLDAPVARYLPELKDMRVVRTDPATGDAILLEA